MADWTYSDAPKVAPTKGWSFQPAPIYESDTDYTSYMDKTFGKGRWRSTSDYRSPAEEDRLRRSGAGTVTPGRLSRHSMGAPDAPGAHDFIVPGLSQAEVLAKLKGGPFEKAFLEQATGPEGVHWHADERNEAGWKFTPSQTQSPAQGGWTFAPATSPPPSPPAKPAYDPTKPLETDTTQFAPRFEEGTAKRTHEALEDLRAQSREPGSAWDFTPLGPAMKGLRTAVDLLGVALSPIGGAAEAAARFNPAIGSESAVQRERPKLGALRQQQIAETAKHPGAAEKTIGDIAEAVAPIPAAEDAAEAVKLAAGARRAVFDFKAGSGAAKAARGTADTLRALQGSNISDRIETQQFLHNLPPELKDPGVRERLYHALEGKLTDPNAEIPEDLKAAHEAIQPYLQEQTDLINDLRKSKDPTVQEFVEGQHGYVHRIGEHDPLLTDSDEGGPRSPFLTRKSLAKGAAAQKARKYVVLEDPTTGERFFPNQDGTKNPYEDLRPGMTYRPEGEAPGGGSKTFDVKQPTTKEIEENTPTRYRKDAIGNTILNVMQLRRAKRNSKALEKTLTEMADRGVAHREEWRYTHPETGVESVGRAKQKTPEGFREIPDVPQLKGWKFDLEDAQVQELKDWLPKYEESGLKRLDRINNFLLRSNFLSPFVHPKNIAEFWGTSRGWDWLNPVAYGRLARTLPEAWREVMTMGPKFKEMLRSGSSLMSGDARAQEFSEMLTNKVGDELINDPKSFQGLERVFGKGVVGSAADLYKRFQEASHRAMWSIGDVMMMQRVLELQQKGTPLRDAIRKAEEVIPNYRVPAQILKSRMLNKLFSSNRFISIGPYHYNRLAAWGRMFKKVAVGSMEEKKEALGQFLAMAAIGAFVVPAIDRGLQIATGNENARVKRGGILVLPDAAERVREGKEQIPQAIAQVIDLSPQASLATEYIDQKDFFGDPMTSQFKSGAANVAGEIEPALSQFGPVQGMLNAQRPSYGLPRAVGNAFGVDLPDKPPGQVKGRTAKMLHHMERKKEQSDPTAQFLESLSFK